MELPKIFEGLIIRFVESLPKCYSRVDLFADWYRDFSVKAGEREKEKWKIMLPRDMRKFYSNGENKNRLIHLTFDFMKEYPSRSLSLLTCNVIFLSGRGIICDMLSEERITFYEDLSSDQEEAKLVLHALHALQTINGNVFIWSLFGDTDIIVIDIGLITHFQNIG